MLLVRVIVMLPFILAVASSHRHTRTSRSYDFAGWSQPCKTGSDGSVVHPHDECEINKGFLCQEYEQGEYCGCQIKGMLTYDRTSKECRRRMGAVCYPPLPMEEDQAIAFNAKCHDNAYCGEIDDEVHTRMVKGERVYHYACLCRPNYHYKKEGEDMEGCVSMNKAQALVSIFPDKTLCLASWIFTFLTFKVFIR